MNFYDRFHDLHQKNPTRNPGSAELRQVIEQTRTAAVSLDLALESMEIPVYSVRTALFFFSLFSVAASLLSLAIPWAGVAVQLLLGVVLIREIVTPGFSRLKPGRSTDLVLRIPARSKETQRIYLSTALSTDFVNDWLSGSLGPWLLISIAILPLFLLALNVFTGWHAGIYVDLLILFIGFLSTFHRRQPSAGTLANSAVLLELAAILSKSRASTTAVTILLTGARSLNSGLLSIYSELKQSELAYLVNLVDHPGKPITLISSEGQPIPKRSELELLDPLSEAAERKSIEIVKASLPDLFETYPLKLMGRKAVTVTNPLTEASHKDLRELLTGLIRHLDHPQNE